MRGRSGARDFSRVIVVSELGRNNGMTSGARLHWAALRKLGVEAGLLDAALALRKHPFGDQHVPASAYIFHADGPQTAALIRSVFLPNATLAGLPDRPRELPDPPLDWSDCDRDVAEVWTPSAFARDSFARPMEIPDGRGCVAPTCFSR
jgi:hypothetical protein